MKAYCSFPFLPDQHIKTPNCANSCMRRRNLKTRMWSHVKKMLKEAHIILEVVDARRIGQTRMPRIESGYKSKLFIAATKSDLLPSFPTQKSLDSIPIFYVSSKTKRGIGALKESLLKTADEKLKIKQPPITIVAFGIPNVGKSSLINSILGKNIAKTGFRAGITTGEQWINLSEKIRLIDVPGVVEFAKSTDDLALSAAIDAQNLKNPQATAEKVLAIFLQNSDDSIFEHYKMQKTFDIEKVLTHIAELRGKLQKGGTPNTDEAARILLREWQKGKIRLQK